MKFKLLAVLAAAMVFATSSAWATSVTFNFSGCPTSSFPGSCPGNLGTPTATYSMSGLSVTLTGYNGAATNNLYVKNTPVPEDGVGLAGTSDNEINSGQYIYLNMSNLLSHGITKGTLDVSSLQSGEVGMVCDTTAAGMPGTSGCMSVTEMGSSGTNSAAISWSSADPFVDLTASSGNVLLGESLSVMPIPEPASLALLGLGLLGAGILTRKKSFLHS